MRFFVLCGAVTASLFSSDALTTVAMSEAFNPIVITGTRTAYSLADVPVRTEVIDSETLATRHVRDVAEALDLVPGLYVRATHGKEGQSVLVQGFDSDRVLILVDGRPLVASTGATVDLTQIPVSDIERIEVVKGATSALYGTSAMGGVINIITRQSSAPLSFSLEAQGGTWGDRSETHPSVYRLASTLGLKHDNLYLKLNADTRHDSGFSDDPEAFALIGQESTRSNLKVESGWRTDSQQVALLYERLDEEKYRPSMLFVAGIGYREQVWTEDVQSDGLGLNGSHRFGTQELRWRIWQQDYAAKTVTDTLSTAFTEDTRRADIRYRDAEVQWNLPLGDRHLITLGSVLHEESLEQTKAKGSATGTTLSNELEEDAMRNNVEFFAQDDWNVGEDTELLPGIRWQNDSDFGAHAAPKINLMHILAHTPYQTNLRLGVGAGYRVPTLKERYYSFDQSQHSYMVIGNPELKPEYSTSYQAGVEFLAPEGSSLGVNLYYNDIRDLIDTAFNATLTQENGLNTYNYQNLEHAVTKGAELSFNYRAGPWRFQSGYTYLKATNETTGKVLTERPEHQAKASLEWRDKSTSFVLLHQQQSKEQVADDNGDLHPSPAYGLWDIKATWKLSGGFEVFGGVENLADIHRDMDELYDVRPKEGRFAYMGIRLNYTASTPTKENK